MARNKDIAYKKSRCMHTKFEVQKRDHGKCMLIWSFTMGSEGTFQSNTYSPYCNCFQTLLTYIITWLALENESLFIYLFINQVLQNT